jgi:epoxyqueuosine reductase
MEAQEDRSMDRESLTTEVKQEAARLGFELVGVTTPDAPPHLDVYRGWIGDGRHGEMDYLATERGLERRADPRTILPECRSILVVGLRHALPTAGDTGIRIAAYAQGVDYHQVIVPRLERLMHFIEPLAAPPFTYRLYTDTGPILERELAQRAGLGWIGKNTCLIHPRHGSYFLLGEALLSEALQPDAPFTFDHCGSCTRCLDACPTQCILPDRTIDARRCISYLTIENRGPIPLELRAPVGDWLFGCDICQQVCPWNVRFAGPTGDADCQPSARFSNPEPAGFLDEAAPLGKTAVARARRNGMARNAAVVMGNRGHTSDVAFLRGTLLNHRSPLVRAHAAWALGEIGGDQAEEALNLAAESESDSIVREEITAAGSHIADAWPRPSPGS